MGRDDQTDASRTGREAQERYSASLAINAEPYTLADEKAIDPDSPGTASDYRGSTSGLSESEPGVRPRRYSYVDTEDEGL